MQPLSISALDGYTLGATQYLPEKSNQKAILFCGAMGVKQSFYAAFAQFLADAGFTVYTFDYRGMGASKPSSLRGFETSIQTWGEQDLAGVLAYIQQQHPNYSIQTISHSVGGQILGLAANNHLISKALMVASQSGNWRFWSKGKTKVWVLWYLAIPTLSRLFGYFPAEKMKLFDNLPKGVALEWAKWGRHPDYFMGYIGTEKAKGYHQINCPMLSYSFEDDEFAPKPAVEWLNAQYKNAQCTHKHLIPKDLNLKSIGHFNFFKDKFKDTFWAEALHFLQS